MEGGYGKTFAEISELTDAEIVEVLCHSPDRPNSSDPRPAWTGGEDNRTVLAGGTDGDETQTPLTPEEEVEQFVLAAQALGMSDEKVAQARAYAEEQLRKYKESHGR